MLTAPRIYSFQRTASGASPRPQACGPAIAAAGFSVVHLVHASAVTIAGFAKHKLQVMVDVDAALGDGPANPRARLHQEIRAALQAGVAGICLRNAPVVTAATWRLLLSAIRSDYPQVWFCADALGRHLEDQWALGGAGFDFIFSSIGWWNGVDSWFWDQQRLYPAIARSIGFPVMSPGAPPAERIDRYRAAALLSAGVLLHAGEEQEIGDEIAAINRVKAQVPALNADGELRSFGDSEQAAGFVRRGGGGGDPVVIVLNWSPLPVTIDLDAALLMLPEDADLRELAPAGKPWPLLPQLEIPPHGWRLLEAVGAAPRREPDPPAPSAERPPVRVMIERLQPEIDGGQFAVKRIIGDELLVTADVLRDGHDKIQGELRVRQWGETDWAAVPLVPEGNDRWAARFPLTRVGEARFVVVAWTDHFGSWRDEVMKKRAAGQTVTLELAEGLAWLESAVRQAGATVRPRLESCLARLDDPRLSEAGRLGLLLSVGLSRWMALVPDREDAAWSPPRRVAVDRVAARFSAWYEVFPRSQGFEPGQASGFDDCIRRLPAVREMGFDVLYFVPIHPIGEKNRKGRNNHPRAEPGEPGSPYAIGSALGGHTAIDPSLGTLDDFRRLVRSAREHGLEVALDFAVQCAPDHPWLAGHPGWFKRRADGSIKHAENPPKKYEDIVNVDFDCGEWRLLWEALRDTVKFWVREGVKIFRVDNPHTKPVAFWHWLMESIRAVDPDVLFLAEAFTRPKMMRRLAKEGFSQSYTYFTWRTTKAELTEYLTELTRTESVEYFRPNFFPTTPDILPFHLQTGGRAAFRSRLVLAATLSASYGLYNGYELCEAEAAPGKEEYRNSEKYQFKVWDWDRPGNIVADIVQLNRLRRSSPALQLFANLEFHYSSHPEVLFYSKGTADGKDRVIVAVVLTSGAPVQTELEFPPALGPRFVTEELFSGWRQEWTGSRQVVTLDPEAQPALVWRVQ